MSDGALRRFPGSDRLLVDPSSGRRAAHAHVLAGASDWRRGVANRLGALVVAAAGPGRLPGAPSVVDWLERTPADVVDEMADELPGLRLIGVALPRQSGRRRLSLLCRQAGTDVIVKLGVDTPGASLETEADCLRMLGRSPLPGIATPDLLAAGTVGVDTDGEPVGFVATSAVAISGQRPAIDAPLAMFERDLAVRLADLPRPADTDDAAVPTHGDLTPWNLRRTARGLALFDWESAGWRAPGSDLATYRNACDEVRPWWRRRGA